MAVETPGIRSVDNRHLAATLPIMHRADDRTVTNMLELPLHSDPADAALRSIELLRDASLPRLLASQLEALIVGGELAPGERVNELSIARNFGISRGPLREALGTLTAQGLLVQHKNRGTFVRQVDASEAEEIYALRQVLELAAIDAIEAMGSEQRLRFVAGFDLILESMAGAIWAQDSRKYYVLNLAFHELLVSASDNQKMLVTYRALVRELVLFRRRNLRGVASMTDSLKEHRHIVVALKNNDIKLARAEVIAHIGEGRIRVLNKKDTTT